MELIDVSDTKTFRELQAYSEENQLQVCDLHLDRVEMVSDLHFSLGSEERSFFG